MKNKILNIIIGLLVSIVTANAQFQNYVLNSSQDSSKNYIGRDYVMLKPGFSFNSSGKKELKIQTRKSLTPSEVNSFVQTPGITNTNTITTIDKSLAVGEIPISSSVSPSGAKCYHVPLFVIPGRQGFQPNLSLAYNSQNGNGTLGMGWNLNGLSSVIRVNKNIFYDNLPDLINYDNNDAFELDGNRLIKMSTTNSVITYETSQGNTKIEAYVDGNIIKYFKAYYADGSVAILGFEDNTINSLSYPVTKLSDMRGNNISFSYSTEGLIHYITSIQYGGKRNSGGLSVVADFANIKFEYEDRPDKISAYLRGQDAGIKKRLTTIKNQFYPDTTTIRAYNLVYNSSSEVSCLSHINATALKEKLNPIKFYYGENTQPTILKRKINISDPNFDVSKVNVMRGKFDAKSSDDALVTFPKNEMYKCDDESLQLYSTNYPADCSINVYQNLKSDNPTVSSIKADNGLVGVFFANIDGAGKDELIKINNTVHVYHQTEFYEDIAFSIYNADINSGIKRVEKLYLPYSTKGGTLEPGQIVPSDRNSVSIVPRDFLVGNFTGKGVTEILMIPKYFYPDDMPQNKTYIVSLETKADTICSTTSLSRAFNNAKVTTMDVDGDGQTEVLRTYESSTKVYKYKKGSGFVEVGTWALSMDDFAKRQILFADLNGDGNMDIIKSPLTQAIGTTKIIQTPPDWFKGPLRVTEQYIKCKECSYIHKKLVEVRSRIYGQKEYLNSTPYIFFAKDGKYYDSSDSRYSHHVEYIENGHYSLPRIIGDSVFTACPGCQSTFKYKIFFDDGNHCCFCNRELNDWQWNSRKSCSKHGFAEDGAGWVRTDTKQYTIEDNNWIYEYTDGRTVVRSEVIPGITHHNQHKYSIHESNGDDVPDLILQESGQTTRIIPFNVVNNSFDQSNITAIDGLPEKYEYIDYDINLGYKYSSLLAYGGNELHLISFTHNHTRCNMLSTMVNSLGVVDKTEYNQIIQTQTNVPLPGAFTEIINPLWVTSQTSALLNNQILSNMAYTYENPVLHKHGLGFCGFKASKTTDLLRSQEIRTEYDPMRLGVITKQVSEIEESVYNYDYKIAPNKKIKLIMVSKSEKDKLKGNTLSTIYTDYDVYTNPLSETQDFGNGIKSTIVRTYENRISNTLRLIGMPSSVLTTTERNGKKSTEKIQYKYNSDNLLESTTKSIGDGVKLTPFSSTAYDYDSYYATLTESSVTNLANNDKLMTFYEYDSSGLLRSLTDPMGLTTTYDYNSKRLLLSQMDYLGKTTLWTYDNWGRKTTEISPDGITTNLKMEWSNDAKQNSVIKQTTTATGQPTTYTFVDALGREQCNGMVGFDGTEVKTDKTYDNFGRLESSSNPYKAGETASRTTYLYDKFDRILNINQPGGSSTTVAYNGNTVTETKDGVTTSKTTDATGQLISSTDAGGTVTYTYRADGKPEIITANGAETTLEYDDPYYRQTKLSDPSAGVITTAYNDIDRSITKTMNSGKTIKSVFNNLGQLISKNTEDMNALYSYENSKIKTIQINSVKNTNENLLKNITYDSFDRIKSVSETNGGKTYQETYEYKDGKIQSIRYEPIGYTVNYNYNNFGYLDKLTDASNKTIREVKTVNAFGQETEVGFGNGLSTGYSYTTEGLIKNIKTYNAAKTIQNMNFDLNSATGVLNSRTSKTNQVNNPILNESFTYGDLYRLQTYGTNDNKQIVSYSANGNIVSKSDAGNYAFNAAGKPYTLTAIDNYSNALNNTLAVSYNVMSRPDTLKLNSYSAIFKYDDAYDRTFEQIKNGNTDILSKYYFANGQYEVAVEGGKEKQRLYLDGSPYSASVIAEKIDGQTKIYYLHRDYLGSITQITDESANLAAEYSYDAWGRMRDVNTWQVFTPGTEPKLLFERGYTGHEHLSQFGLINMNARLYDPVLGRFISPDPLVGSPDMSNSYNRYVYASNNPLMYVDLDGEQQFRRSDGGMGPVGNGDKGINWNVGNNNQWSNSGGGYNPFPGSYNNGGMGSPGTSGSGNSESYNSGYSGGGSGWGSLIVAGLKWLLFHHRSPKMHTTAMVTTVYKAPQSTSTKITLAKVATNSGSQTSYSGGQSRMGSAIRSFANEAQYFIPVWGACQQCSDALNNGEYLASVGYFGLGLLDMFSLGTLTEVRATMNAAAAAERIAVASRGIEAANVGSYVAEQSVVHGNSLKSIRPTWGYKLYSTDGAFLKNGITSKINPRRRYTKKFMEDKYMKETIIFPNRFEAWKWEFRENQILRGPLNKNMH